MRELSLTEILSPDQIREVKRIMRKSENEFETLLPLVAFLKTIKPPLEDKGVLPEYLAYWLNVNFQD